MTKREISQIIGQVQMFPVHINGQGDRRWVSGLGPNGSNPLAKVRMIESLRDQGYLIIHSDNSILATDKGEQFRLDFLDSLSK